MFPTIKVTQSIENSYFLHKVDEQIEEESPLVKRKSFSMITPTKQIARSIAVLNRTPLFGRNQVEVKYAQV